jgi:hypothetical protein
MDIGKAEAIPTMSSSLLSLVLLSLLASPSLAATITQASQLKSRTFDYIIVGGQLL